MNFETSLLEAVKKLTRKINKIAMPETVAAFKSIELEKPNTMPNKKAILRRMIVRCRKRMNNQHLKDIYKNKEKFFKNLR